MCEVLCAADAAMPEAGGSLAHHGQHADERPELPLTRHLHHPPLPDEGLPAGPPGEVPGGRGRGGSSVGDEGGGE